MSRLDEESDLCVLVMDSGTMVSGVDAYRLLPKEKYNFVCLFHVKFELPARKQKTQLLILA